MRRVILIYLLFLNVCVVRGALRSDSIDVFFALNKATLDTAHNDMVSMRKFIDGIVVSANSGTLDNISVYGYASPDGRFRSNNTLAKRRVDAVASYISRHAGIPLNSIDTYPGVIAWGRLRDLVIRHEETPCRDEVIRVLDKYLPDAYTSQAADENCKKGLLAIDSGLAYKWLLDNLFPKLRSSLAVYTYTSSDEDADSPAAEGKYMEIPDSLLGDYAISLQLLPVLPDCQVMALPYAFVGEPSYRLALKTNLLYDAALFPDLEVEWLINRKWSVALDGTLAWWHTHPYVTSLKLCEFAMVSPEVKRWIRPRAPWHGFYVGAFAGGNLYDFGKTDWGYRGEGVMAGLSVGFMWPIGRCLSLEAAVGAGYLYTRYREYKPIDGHHVYQRTKDLNYFGPLKVKLALVWRLWDKNGSGRGNHNTSAHYDK